MLSVVIDDKKSNTIPERGMYKTNVHCTNGTFGEWDYNNWNLVLNNVSSESKCNIEFTSGLSESDYNNYIEAGKALHRNTYRGKDITSYLTDGSLYTRISNGSFEDIYVGDYIVANNVTWLIADIDNYLHTGELAELLQHHVTVIPAMPLVYSGIHNTNINIEGYANSKMATEILPSLVANEGIIGKTFGNHILEYDNMLSDGINKSAINKTGGIYLGATNHYKHVLLKASLMSEISVYGVSAFSSSVYDIGIDNKQFALFQLKPEFINSYGNVRFSYWLKDIAGMDSAGNTWFVLSHSVGMLGHDWSFATGANGVRPSFLIG